MSTPGSTWRAMREANARFAGGPGGGADEGCRTKLAESVPSAVVFSCSDAGLSVETLFDQRPGTLFKVTTWGHVFSAGIVGSIEYALAEWVVPLVVVLGHDGCAALRVAVDDEEAWGSSGGFLGQVVKQLRLSSAPVGRNALCDGDGLGFRHVAATGAALLAGSALLGQRVRQGKCAIVCVTSGIDGRVSLHKAFGDLGATVIARQDG